MLCPCLSRFLVKPNTLVLQCRGFVTTINENVLNSSTQVVPESPSYDTRLLKVAIIGMPNSGKSTLINGLMDRKVCATSSKVHTTRAKAKAIFTSEDTQIIFIDTPGLVNEREQKRFNLYKPFLRDSKAVSQEANVIGVIQDVSNIWTRDRLDIKIVKILEKHKQKRSFLVMNKVDLLKSKQKLLDLTKILTENSINGKPIEVSKLKTKEDDCENRGWPYFSDIFMVSALTGDGLEGIKNYLIKNAKPGEWLFPENVWTDQKAESLIINAVKAALLNYMPQEIPYKLDPVMEYFKVEEETGKIRAVVLIRCPTERLAKLLSGASDGRIRMITENVQKDLQESFQNFVKIQLIPLSVDENKN